jgi:uncharacterized OB-fold protein
MAATSMNDGTLPAPNPDQLSEPFWAALAEHRVMVQECPACGRRRFPRLPSCPYCASEGGDEVEAAGTGVVYSFVRVHRALTPATVGEVPYCVATVDLDGGGRLFARVEPPEAVEIGLAVTPLFIDHDGWTELRFAPAG